MANNSYPWHLYIFKTVNNSSKITIICFRVSRGSRHKTSCWKRYSQKISAYVTVTSPKFNKVVSIECLLKDRNYQEQILQSMSFFWKTSMEWLYPSSNHSNVKNLIMKFFYTFAMFCAICYHLYNLKTWKTLMEECHFW